VKVATGEHCANRVMFKQLMQAGAIHFRQIDSCRVGGVNEVLAIMLMAAKFGIPVCPHAGGVGLCEYVQHLSMLDYISISGSMEGRIIEYVDHLHQHFLQPVVIPIRATLYWVAFAIVVGMIIGGIAIILGRKKRPPVDSSPNLPS